MLRRETQDQIRRLTRIDPLQRRLTVSSARQTPHVPQLEPDTRKVRRAHDRDPAPWRAGWPGLTDPQETLIWVCRAKSALGGSPRNGCGPRQLQQLTTSQKQATQSCPWCESRG